MSRFIGMSNVSRAMRRVIAACCAMHIAVWLICCVLMLTLACAQTPDSPPKQGAAAKPRDVSTVIAALLETPVVYIDDGAHDTSVDLLAIDPEGVLNTPEGRTALIARLDDVTPTHAIVRQDQAEIAVPAGYLCLDTLLLLTRRDSIVIKHPDAADDSWWPTVGPRYFYEPDVLKTKDAATRMKKVRQAWQRALARNQLTFDSQKDVLSQLSP